MARGLSELQKTILIKGYENQQAEGRTPETDTGADCYYPEVLAAYYGWEGQLRQRSDGKRIVGGQRFSRAEIGDQKYNAAIVALRRAVLRLEARGLVWHVWGAYRHWNGVTLTAAGTEVARKLSVKQSELVPKG